MNPQITLNFNFGAGASQISTDQGGSISNNLPSPSDAFTVQTDAQQTALPSPSDSFSTAEHALESVLPSPLEALDVAEGSGASALPSPLEAMEKAASVQALPEPTLSPVAAAGENETPTPEGAQPAPPTSSRRRSK